MINDIHQINDTLYEASKYMSPDDMIHLIDLMEAWVIEDRPDIKMIDACFLSRIIGIAS